jgi:SpoVK/Ycf46/Vps4 family AAA+-type ATPase
MIPTSFIAEDYSLLSVLRSLDRLLDHAISQAKQAYENDTIPASYRGLYINQNEIERVMQREPGESPLQGTTVEFEPHFAKEIRQSKPLSQLQQMFNLSDFDLALVTIALAPEIDLRYERIYAYLQDDVTRKRPTVELALNLLCDSAETKLRRRAHLTSNSPLMRCGILHLAGDVNHAQPSFLAYALKLDEQIVRFLLDIPGLDERLQPFGRLIAPSGTLAQLPVTPETQKCLATLTAQFQSTPQPLRLYLQGPSGMGKRRAAEAIALQLNQSFLSVDLGLLLEQTQDLTPMFNLLYRESFCQNAILYFCGWDAMLKREYGLVWQSWLDFAANFPSLILLAGQQRLPADIAGQIEVVAIALTLPDAAQRRTYWQSSLTNAGIDLDLSDLNALSDRFRLAPEQIDRAIAIAVNQTCWTTAHPTSTQSEALFRAARQQSGQELAKMAQKVSAKSTWDDIVLPPDPLAQLREVCNQAKYQSTILGQWGFDRKLSRGKGITALFSGPPGTGKTMAAEVLAHDLQLDLYKIDLSQIISKYIGETEKNLDRIFTAAHNANAILFFDEADALFGKRSEVKDAHDRHANIEVAYLLQKMEEFEGVAILATNLRQNMDDAFIRRIQAIIEFPFPDEESRHNLWQVAFPKEAPLSQEVDFGFLAREIKLAGGNIKNISLAAAFYAATEGCDIGKAHLFKAASREHRKLGRSWQIETSHCDRLDAMHL